MVDKTFRSDLFYRLQVFPIEIRPLRERIEDIPLLVEYFIDRYASKMGKKIRGINRKSLDLLRSYFWPGNIRELQNIIERAVIVCDTEVLSIDESWLSQPPGAPARSTGTLSKIPPDREKKMIEAALAESRGRVSSRPLAKSSSTASISKIILSLYCRLLRNRRSTRSNAAERQDSRVSGFGPLG